MSGKRHSLITPSEVDQVFNDAVIKELCDIVNVSKGDNFRFVQSIRNDVRLFIEAKARLSNPQLRTEIERLHTLNNRALRGDREAQQLARAVDLMHADVRDWLARCNPKHCNIPTAEEIASPPTRAGAVQRLRLILSYGGRRKEGRMRPTGRRSSSFEPMLKIPGGEAKKTEQKGKKKSTLEGRPRGEAEREFLQNLALTYTELTEKPTPYTANYYFPDPFLNFVHRCFELVGAPKGDLIRLINERGMKRRKLEKRLPIGTAD
jgi:hypothetical protein